MKTKEKILKEAFEYMFQHTFRNVKGDLNSSKVMSSASVYEVSNFGNKIIELCEKEKDKELNKLAFRIIELERNQEKFVEEFFDEQRASIKSPLSNIDNVIINFLDELEKELKQKLASKYNHSPDEETDGNILCATQKSSGDNPQQSVKARGFNTETEKVTTSADTEIHEVKGK